MTRALRGCGIALTGGLYLLQLALVPAGTGTGSAFGSGLLAPVIRHESIEFMPNNRFPQVEAVVEPAGDIRSAKLYFRSAHYPDFYYVEMVRDEDDDTFVGILPMPSAETVGVVYYIEAMDVTFESLRTMAYQAKTTDQPVVASFGGTEPNIEVGKLRASAPDLPPGFLDAGIVTFIGVTGVTMAAGGGPAGGGPAGGGTAGGAAAGGGGIGAGTAVIAGVGIAGAVGGLAVLRPKEEDGEPLRACFSTSPDPPVIKEGESIQLDASCSEPSASITSYQWDLGDDRSRQGRSVRVTYRRAGTFTVSLTVSDGTQSDTTTRTVTVSANEADLSVTKRDTSGGSVDVGETFDYEIEVTNNGPDEATRVVLTDSVPSGVAVGQIKSPSNVTCSFGGGTVTCRASTLPSGATFAVSFEVTPQEVGPTITNTVQVSANESDPRMSNNTATVTTEVTVPRVTTDLSVDKSERSVKDDPVLWNDTLTYDVRVTNEGPNDATNVILTDTLPDEVNFVSSRPLFCAVSGTEVTCSLGNLKVGATITVAITVQVNVPQTRCPVVMPLTDCRGVFPFVGCCLINVARVSSNEIDPNSLNDSSAERTSVQGTIPLRESQIEASFTSFLEVPAERRARGRVRLNRVRVDATDSSVPFRHSVRGREENTVEAHTASELGGEGFWRFDFSGGTRFVPGSIRVELGQVLSLDAYTVVFRLSGAPGERIKFTYRLRR
jgi:uncharacterized repeat protein (TIGR01451 family)